MIKQIVKVIKKIWYTRPQCPVNKKWCAHYDGIYCTMDKNCSELKTDDV